MLGGLRVDEQNLAGKVASLKQQLAGEGKWYDHFRWALEESTRYQFEGMECEAKLQESEAALGDALGGAQLLLNAYMAVCSQLSAAEGEILALHTMQAANAAETQQRNNLLAVVLGCWNASDRSLAIAEGEIQRLQGSLAAKDDQLLKRGARVATLLSRCLGAESEKNQLREASAHSQEVVQQLLAENARAQETIAGLGEDVAELEGRKECLAESWLCCSQQFRDAKKEARAAKKELGAAKSEIRALKRARWEDQTLIESLQLHVDGLMHQVDTLHARLAVARPSTAHKRRPTSARPRVERKTSNGAPLQRSASLAAPISGDVVLPESLDDIYILPAAPTPMPIEADAAGNAERKPDGNTSADRAEADTVEEREPLDASDMSGTLTSAAGEGAEAPIRRAPSAPALTNEAAICLTEQAAPERPLSAPAGPSVAAVFPGHPTAIDRPLSVAAKTIDAARSGQQVHKRPISAPAGLSGAAFCPGAAERRLGKRLASDSLLVLDEAGDFRTAFPSAFDSQPYQHFAADRESINAFYNWTVEGVKRDVCARFGAPKAEELQGMYPSSFLDPLWEEWEEYGCPEEDYSDDGWGDLRGGRVLLDHPRGFVTVNGMLVEESTFGQWDAPSQEWSVGDGEWW